MTIIEELKNYLVQKGIISNRDNKKIGVSLVVGDAPKRADKLSRRYILSLNDLPILNVKFLPTSWEFVVDDISQTRAVYSNLNSFKVPSLFGQFSTSKGHFFVEKYLEAAVGMPDLIDQGQISTQQAREVMKDIFHEIWLAGEPASSEFINSEIVRYKDYLKGMIEERSLYDMIVEYIERTISDNSMSLKETWSSGDIMERNVVFSGGHWYLIDYEYCHKTIFLFKEAYRSILYSIWAKDLSLKEMFPWLGSFPEKAAVILSLSWERYLYSAVLDEEANQKYHDILKSKLLDVMGPQPHRFQINGQEMAVKVPVEEKSQMEVQGGDSWRDWKIMNHGKRFTSLFRVLFKRIMKRINPVKRGLEDDGKRINISDVSSTQDPYQIWISRNEPSINQLDGMKIKCQSWPYQPKISIIVPVYNPLKGDLMDCLQSVLGQIYKNWEVCLVDGGSDRPYVRSILKKFGDKDPRIQCVTLSKNHGIAANSNEALKLASGDYIAFLDHDDTLAPFALYEVVKLLNQDPTIDFIYSDEDKIPINNARRYDHFFKPEWSPDTFLSYNYLCHFALIRRSLVEKVGGFREGYDGAQDYDLFLRIVQNTNRIRHIPKVLYHWRAAKGSSALVPTAKPKAPGAAKKAIQEFLNAKGLEGEVIDGLFPTSYRVRYKMRLGQKVSIIIPTRDKSKLLRQCVSSVLEKTEYQNYQIMIVDNGSCEEETFSYYDSLKKNERVSILQYNKPFNYSAINNYAVRKTDSEYLLLLNNDTEVISGEWLSAMLEFAQRKDVGAVGAKLLYPDRTIQHAGVVLGIGGYADHVHKHVPESSSGYMGRINVIQNLSVVTGACMMVRRGVFEEVGGFDESFSHSFNDVDLCLKIREKGYLIIYTPYAELTHHESASRGRDDKPEKQAKALKEAELLKSRWKSVLEAGDPYYNPNLTLEKRDYSIKL